MTSKTETIAVRDLLAVIDEAFHGADACHCQTVAKLGGWLLMCWAMTILVSGPVNGGWPATISKNTHARL